jgi:hypothetical protein
MQRKSRRESYAQSDRFAAIDGQSWSFISDGKRAHTRRIRCGGCCRSLSGDCLRTPRDQRNPIRLRLAYINGFYSLMNIFLSNSLPTVTLSLLLHERWSASRWCASSSLWTTAGSCHRWSCTSIMRSASSYGVSRESHEMHLIDIGSTYSCVLFVSLSVAERLRPAEA